jgi:AcrR family transcriptional regulator
MKQVSVRRAASRSARSEIPAPRVIPITPRGQRTRQALLDAAERVFGELGFHNAGIVEITQKADVALGTFYLYFPDKRAIFRDLVQTLNERLRAAIRERVQGIEERLEVEVAGFETFFQFVREHRDLYRVVLQAETVDEEMYRWHYRTLADGYVRGLKAAQAKGQVRADMDPETLAYALMGMAEALGMRSVLWDGKLPSPSARRTIRAFLEGGLGAKKAAKRRMR